MQPCTLVMMVLVATLCSSPAQALCVCVCVEKALRTAHCTGDFLYQVEKRAPVPGGAHKKRRRLPAVANLGSFQFLRWLRQASHLGIHEIGNVVAARLHASSNEELGKSQIDGKNRSWNPGSSELSFAMT